MVEANVAMSVVNLVANLERILDMLKVLQLAEMMVAKLEIKLGDHLVHEKVLSLVIS